MSRLTTGGVMPEFTFVTPFETGRSLSETVGRVQGKTALVFLRYYGCTLCQYDIHQFAQAKEAIGATGGQMLVVLQSDPALLAGQLKREDLPFDIICDPDQTLYKQFEIKPAESKLKLADPGTVLKIGKAKAAGFEHGANEGDELQLPAVFVLDSARQITYAHYGVSAGDVPSPEQLAERLK